MKRFAFCLLMFCALAVSAFTVNTQTDGQIILRKMESSRGAARARDAVQSIAMLRERVRLKLERDQFDTAMKQLSDRKQVTLHLYDPAWNFSERERAEMLRIGDALYHAASLAPRRR